VPRSVLIAYATAAAGLDGLHINTTRQVHVARAERGCVPSAQNYLIAVRTQPECYRRQFPFYTADGARVE